MTSIRRYACRTLTILVLCLAAMRTHAQLPIVTGIDPTDTTMRYDLAFEHQEMENNDEREVVWLRGNIALHDNCRLSLETRYISLEYRDSTPDTGYRSENGMGDLSAEVLYNAYARGAHTLGYGLRVTLDTATEDELAQGGTSVAPLAVWSFRCPNDIIVAPSLQWTYGADLDRTPYRDSGDLNEVTLKAVLAWEPMIPEVSWLLAEPKLAVDFGDEDETRFDLSLEYGLMFTETMAVFARPTFGSNDSDLDWAFLVGFRHLLREWVLFE